MKVLPLSVPHGAPAVGFVIRRGSATVAFTGDTGGGLLPFLAHSPSPQILFVEVTFSNDGEARARASRHLTPSILLNELVEARRCGLPLPQIVVVHRDPSHEHAILQELAEVSKKLNITITPAHANHRYRP